MRVRTTATIALLLLVTMLAAGCGADDDDARDAGSDRTDTTSEPAGTDEPVEPTPAPASEIDEVFEVVVVDGAVEGGPQAFRVQVGDKVQIDVQSDADDEVHVHGIDAEAPVEAGASSSVKFQVTSSGSYEVELHDSGAILGTVEVR